MQSRSQKSVVRFILSKARVPRKQGDGGGTEPFLVEVPTSGSIPFKALLLSRAKKQEDSNTAWLHYNRRQKHETQHTDKISVGFASLDSDLSKPEGTRAL